MKRILTYSIGADTAGWSILTFLKQNQYSHSVITQLKKTECGILVNGVWAYVNQILQEGDELCIQLIEYPDSPAIDIAAAARPDNISRLNTRNVSKTTGRPSAGYFGKARMLSAGMLLDIVYEDEDLAVINKPAGMPVHPSMEHYGDTLADALLCHARQKNEWYPYRCINRLDRDTSGLTVIAKNAYSSCILYGQMRSRRIVRTYYAIVQGRTKDCGTIDAPISRKDASVIEREVNHAAGQSAVTHYQRLAYKDGLSFIKLQLETGRTHQIRVHMSYIGHPLIGDFLYNPKDSRMKRQALHAGNLAFTHPVSGRALDLYAQLPEDMLQFFHMVIS